MQAPKHDFFSCNVIDSTFTYRVHLDVDFHVRVQPVDADGRGRCLAVEPCASSTTNSSFSPADVTQPTTRALSICQQKDEHTDELNVISMVKRSSLQGRRIVITCLADLYR